MIFVIYILAFFLLAEMVFIIFLQKCNKKNMVKIRRLQELVKKDDRLFRMALKWAEKNEESNFIKDYLIDKGFDSVIIYGMNFAGELLAKSLKKSDIVVVCGIDVNADKMMSFINIIKPSDTIPSASVVIVTAVAAFPMIEENLSKRIDCPIISLEDIIYD